MADAYATPEELTAWLPTGAEVDDPERLLKRASEVIDSHVTAPFWVAESGTPKDETLAGVMRDAACAQVEFWLEVGEEHDITGLKGGASIGQLRIDRLPPTLAPRARRILGVAGMFGDGHPWIWP